MRHFLLSCIVITLAACVAKPPGTPQAALPGRAAITLRMADSLWSARADTTAARAAVKAYQILAANEPDRIEISAKLSRACYFVSQYLTTEPIKKDSLFMRGYEASQAILKRNNQYNTLLYSTGDENLAIRGLDKAYINALYWGMANYGQWLATKGDLIRLGQREVIWTTLEHIHELDSTFYFGAYYRYKGALLCRDPKFRNETTLIRESFEKAQIIAPKYLGNNTLMAAYYCPLAGDRTLFYKLLTEVVTAKLDPALPYYPENLQEKRMAERLLIRAQREKWFN